MSFKQFCQGRLQSASIVFQISFQCLLSPSLPAFPSATSWRSLNLPCTQEFVSKLHTWVFHLDCCTGTLLSHQELINQALQTFLCRAAAQALIVAWCCVWFSWGSFLQLVMAPPNSSPLPLWIHLSSSWTPLKITSSFTCCPCYNFIFLLEERLVWPAAGWTWVLV